MKFPDKVYDALKWICLIGLPAVAFLWGKLAGIWGWYYSSEITETIVAVQLFIGMLIGVSTAQYYKDKDNGTR